MKDDPGGPSFRYGNITENKRAVWFYLNTILIMLIMPLSLILRK